MAILPGARAIMGFPKLRLAAEGWPFLLSGLSLAAILAWVGWGLLSPGLLLRTPLQVLALVVGGLAVFSAFFFRDPLRVPPGGSGLVVAPADGRVISIDEVEEPTVLGGPATRIATFLSVFDVHVQRAPASGRVVHRSYQPGRYLAAWNPRASQENEQASLGIATERDRLLVRQIAGLVARRVVTDPDEGDLLEQGERIGLIRFGSRVDVYLPIHYDVLCEKGDRVKGGSTVVARDTRAGSARSPGGGEDA
jgi:phosphatidylserine decarboxylase